MSTFLEPHDLAALTGRKIKSKQIEALRQMGIPYFVNATGHPIVTQAALNNKKEAATSRPWSPHVLSKH